MAIVWRKPSFRTCFSCWTGRVHLQRLHNVLGRCPVCLLGQLTTNSSNEEEWLLSAWHNKIFIIKRGNISLVKNGLSEIEAYVIENQRFCSWESTLCFGVCILSVNSLDNSTVVQHLQSFQCLADILPGSLSLIWKISCGSGRFYNCSAIFFQRGYVLTSSLVSWSWLKSTWEALL